MKVEKTKDLIVFRNAHEITHEVYRITRTFPADEKWGLTDPIRRAAASVCSDLLEGSQRNNRLEFSQFAGIANGSAGEVKYQMQLAHDLGCIDDIRHAGLKERSDETCKMLRGLIQSSN